MDAENGAQDPYDAVLADLRAKRDKIDEAIAVIEAVRGTGATSLASTSPRPATQQSDSPPGDLLGMTIADAAIKVLGMRRKTLGNPEFLQEFTRGGLVLTSADPTNVINSVLTRRFNQVGDIVRVSRGQWGLQQWYPNRSFKKKDAAGDKSAEPGKSTVDETTAPAPPSEQMPDELLNQGGERE